MLDLVLVWFGGVVVGCIVMWIYHHYRDWRLDELIDALDNIKDNSHFQNHLRANPELRDKLGARIYDYLVGQEKSKEADK